MATTADIVVCAIHVAVMLAAIAGLLWMLASHKADSAHADHEARVRSTADYLRRHRWSVGTLLVADDGSHTVSYAGPEHAGQFHACQCRPCGRDRRAASRAAERAAREADRQLPRATARGARRRVAGDRAEGGRSS